MFNPDLRPVAMCRAMGMAASLVSPSRPGGRILRHSVALDRKFLQCVPVRTMHIHPMASNVQPSLIRNAFNNTSLFASPLRPALPFSRHSNNCAISHPTIRPFSLLTRPPISAWFLHRRRYRGDVAHTHGIFCRQFHPSQSRPYDRLQNSEDAANRDRDNANAQAVFLQVPTLS